MGLTFLPVKIVNPSDRSKFREIEFLIDTGAMYTVVPKKILHELGFEERGTRNFGIGDGRVIKRSLGPAVYIYNDVEGFAPIVFGEDKDAIILGATALESMGYFVNPVERTIEKILPKI